jgi:hypothetical protein
VTQPDASTRDKACGRLSVQRADKDRYAETTVPRGLCDTQEVCYTFQSVARAALKPCSLPAKAAKAGLGTKNKHATDSIAGTIFPDEPRLIS